MRMIDQRRSFLFKLAGLLVLLALPFAGFAQEESAEQPTRPRVIGVEAPTRPQTPVAEVDSVTKIVTLKHASARNIGEMLAPFGVSIVVGRFPETLVLTGSAESMAAAEAAIGQLDVPEPTVRNVEIIVYMVVASSAANEVYPPIPDVLNPIREKIDADFGLANLRLMETVLMRARADGEVQASGVIPNPAGAPNTGSLSTWRASADRVRITSGDSKAATISLDGLNVGAEIPIAASQPAAQPNGAVRAVRMERRDIGFRCDVDLVESSLAIVGKASIDDASGSVFVVITAHAVPEP